MTHDQALYMRDIILKYRCKNICELGHFHGKSSIYIGSILEEQGHGKLTTFDWTKTRVTPSIADLIKEFDLENYITPTVSAEGYTWDLAALIKADVEKFDFCYIDGGHTFESSTLAFVLTDILLEKNGIVIFDDLYWTADQSVKHWGVRLNSIIEYKNLTDRERLVPPVKMICDIILPHYDYSLLDVVDQLGWIIYQKNS
jgi:predicted O-methyltransferase YrrM